MTATTHDARPLTPPAGSPPPVTGDRPTLARLTAVELRKTLDTRSGRWLVAGLAALAVVGLGAQVVVGEAPFTFSGLLGAALLGPGLLLPVFGVLAMTSEWTRRTALVTFVAVPRRGRVLGAKLFATELLAVATVLLTAGATAVTLAALGAVGGGSVAWGDVPRELVGAVIANVVSVLMGAAIGALLQHTAPALVVYFVAPIIWVAAGVRLLGGEGARWLDPTAAIGSLSSLSLGGVVGPTLVALGVWIVLPLAAGTIRAVRRDVS